MKTSVAKPDGHPCENCRYRKKVSSKTKGKKIPGFYGKCTLGDYGPCYEMSVCKCVRCGRTYTREEAGKKKTRIEGLTAHRSVCPACGHHVYYSVVKEWTPA
jgi:DNA-directed RNA polymerase subunit RPC12/RpoP